MNVFFKMGGNFEETENLFDGMSKWTTMDFPDHYTGSQASQQPKGLVQFSQMAQSLAADINRWCQHKRSPQLRVFISIHQSQENAVCLGMFRKI